QSRGTDTDRNVSTFTTDVGGRGKDAPYLVNVIVPPDLKSKGWIIDVDRLVNPPRGWIRDLGGDHGTCVGADRNSLQPEGFTFVMQLGHKTDTFGHKSDAWQNCRLTVPIVRPIRKSLSGTPIEETMTSAHDERKAPAWCV